MPAKDPEVAAKTLRRNHLQRKHGLTETDYLEALESQQGCCASCGDSKPGNGRKHFTIILRGQHRTGVKLLCASCANTLSATQRSPYRIADDGTLEKLCTGCKTQLSILAFYKRDNGKLSSKCRTCLTNDSKETVSRESRRERNRRKNLKRYGITVEQYDTLLAKQGGGCAICGAKEPGRKAAKYFNVDHEHVGGKVRGLLCHSCNLAIGHLKDRSELCRNAAQYLETNLST
jgi:hypothetical protein